MHIFSSCAKRAHWLDKPACLQSNNYFLLLFVHPQPILSTCSPPVCIKFSLLAQFSLEPITSWLRKHEKEDFSCLSCTKIGESEVWICFDPWIIFLSCKISICLEPGTAPKLGKVYFSQTSEIVFVEYRDLGSSSLRDGCVPIFSQSGIHAHHLHQSAIEIARLLYNLQKKAVLCLACNFHYRTVSWQTFKVFYSLL